MEKVTKRQWYETAFGELYPLVYAHRNDEAASEEALDIVALLGLEDRAARVLDLCCGGGRHTAAFVKMGFDVFGVDLSPSLLAEARTRDGLGGRLVRADMREIPLAGRFDVVLNLFTSFGYFGEDAENKSVVCEMARVLVPGGRLLIDHMNRTEVERHVGVDEQERAGITIRQERRIEGNRVLKDITVIKDGSEPVHLIEDVRIYTEKEMKAMLRATGFEDVKLYGSFKGDPFDADSKRMIAVARRGNCG